MLSLGSYKRVKRRSHTVEKRLNMHPHKPHATSQPSRLLSLGAAMGSRTGQCHGAEGTVASGGLAQPPATGDIARGGQIGL